MRFLLTGSTGMIGLAVTKYLISQGHFVYMVARKDSNKLDKIPESKLVKVIKCDLSELNTLTLDSGIDYLIHLGWDKTIGDGRNNIDIQLKNIDYTLDAVKLAKRSGAKKFIGIGSQAEYGLHNEKLSIDTKCEPITGYGIAKFSAGRFSKLLCQQLNIEYNWIRILSVYGENDSPLTLMSYINKCIKDGVDANVSKCEQIWDYISADEAAKIIYKICLQGKNGTAYPLGSGIGKPLREYIDNLIEYKKSKIKINYGAKPYQDNQVMYLVADMSYLIEFK